MIEFIISLGVFALLLSLVHFVISFISKDNRWKDSIAILSAGVLLIGFGTYVKFAYPYEANKDKLYEFRNVVLFNEEIVEHRITDNESDSKDSDLNDLELTESDSKNDELNIEDLTNKKSENEVEKETTKKEEPEKVEPKKQTPKKEEPKKEEPKKETPKKEEPKKEEPKKEESKVETPKKEEPKKEEPKKEEPKKEEPKKEEPKKENSPAVPAGGMLNVEYSKQMFAMINEKRKAAGLNELVWAGFLENSANVRAIELEEKFSHTRPNGNPWYSVHKNVNGENIACGYTLTGAMDAFMNSAGHRDNILKSDYKSVAVGVYTNQGYHYYVQLFSVNK